MAITRQIAIDLERLMLERFETAGLDYMDSMQRMGATTDEVMPGIGAAMLNITAKYLAVISPPAGDQETGRLLARMISDVREELKRKHRGKAGRNA